MDDIVFKKKYIDLDSIQSIKKFFDVTINDKLDTQLKNFVPGKGMCWDRPLRFEIKKNPIHNIVDKLKKDFGKFNIHTCSIRYMASPFLPHNDIRNSEWLLNQKINYNPGYTFLIPLWWAKNYKPGTAFLSSPAKNEQQLYIEQQDILPKFDNDKDAKNFGIKQVVKWESPGDLIAWKNFQWHCSLTQKNYPYNGETWCKEFISIETAIPKI
jgi:hypothetical protein